MALVLWCDISCTFPMFTKMKVPIHNDLAVFLLFVAIYLLIQLFIYMSLIYKVAYTIIDTYYVVE